MHRGPAATPVRQLYDKLKFLQVNVDRKMVTQDIIIRNAHRDGVHVLILNEPNKRSAKRQGWLTDSRLDVAIVTIDQDLPVHGSGKGDGYALLELEEIVIFSCYCSPNVGISYFDKYIQNLGEEVRKQRKPVIVAGDFNAKAFEWGSPVEDARGTTMMDWASGTDLAVLNRGGRSTFVRNEQQSYIDVTLCTGRVAGKIKNWSVLEEEETLGWHRASDII